MPSNILAALREDLDRQEFGIVTVPTLRRIKYQIQKYKTELYGRGEISLKDLEKFLEENSEVPTDEDEPFVIAYNVTYGQSDVLDFSLDENDDNNEEGPTEETSSFWFLFTTLRLMSVIPKTSLITADSTYKLVWQGYPAVLFGTVDMKRQFHKIAFGMTSNERSSDWSGMFKVQKN